MSNPTEFGTNNLPDLEHTSRLLYTALNNVYQRGGCNPSEVDVVVEALKEYNRYCQFAARRAKPEGEAPQAEAKFKIGDTVRTTDSFKRVGTIRRIDLTHLKAFNVVGDDGGGMFGAWELEHFTPAAQHAESSAPVIKVATWQERSWAHHPTDPEDHVPQLLAEIADLRAALAAQSQGAQALDAEAVATQIREAVNGITGPGFQLRSENLDIASIIRAALAAKAEAPK